MAPLQHAADGVDLSMHPIVVTIVGDADDGTVLGMGVGGITAGTADGSAVDTALGAAVGGTTGAADGSGGRIARRHCID